MKFQIPQCQKDPMNKSHCEIWCQYFLGILEVSLLAMVPRDRGHEWEIAGLLCPKMMKERNYLGQNSDVPCPSADLLLQGNSDIFDVVTSSVFSSGEALLGCTIFLPKITLTCEAPDQKWRISSRCDSMSASVKVVISIVPQGQTPRYLFTLQ